MEIDILSGRIRHTRFILFCRVSERITATPLSEALQPGDFQAAVPEWHRVSTFSPGVHHSPHYRYHGTTFQARMLETLWSVAEFTPAARRESALRLLSAWQRGKNYFAADPYLSALSEVAWASSKPIDVPDLPIP